MQQLLAHSGYLQLQAIRPVIVRGAKTRADHLQELVKRSGILVFASHSNDFLAQLCNTALWIDHGEIRSVGEVSEVVGEYEGPEVGEYVRDLRERFENEDTSGN